MVLCGLLGQVVGLVCVVCERDWFGLWLALVSVVMLAIFLRDVSLLTVGIVFW